MSRVKELPKAHTRSITSPRKVSESDRAPVRTCGDRRVRPCHPRLPGR